jgi:hypothetical protein
MTPETTPANIATDMARAATSDIFAAMAQAQSQAQSLAETLAKVPSVPQAITNYVNKAGLCSFMALYAIFGPEDDSYHLRRKFGQKLADLVASGLIDFKKGEGRDTIENRTYTRASDDQSALVLTPPPQINIMAAPVYVPLPSCVLRPGALDHKRYATRGVRC